MVPALVSVPPMVSEWMVFELVRLMVDPALTVT